MGGGGVTPARFISRGGFNGPSRIPSGILTAGLAVADVFAQVPALQAAKGLDPRAALALELSVLGVLPVLVPGVVYMAWKRRKTDKELEQAGRTPSSSRLVPPTWGPASWAPLPTKRP